MIITAAAHGIIGGRKILRRQKNPVFSTAGFPVPVPAPYTCWELGPKKSKSKIVIRKSKMMTDWIDQSNCCV
jgi:hypothetical protein